MSETLELLPIDTDAPAEPPVASTVVAVAASTSVDLAKVDLTAVALAKFGAWPAAVAEVRKNLSTLALDLSNQARIDEAKSLRHRVINQPIATVRSVSRELKSTMAQAGKAVGAEEARIVAAYEDAAQLISPQIDEAQKKLDDEKEAKRVAEEARVSKHQQGIATIRNYLTQAQGLPSERIAKGIAFLQGMTFGPEWEEFAVPAADAQCQTIEALNRLHTDTLAKEMHDAQQERIRREHADQAQALAITQRAMALMGRPAAEIREALALLKLTAFAEDVSAIVTSAHVQAMAQLEMMLPLAEQREKLEAEAKAAADAAALSVAATPAALPEPTTEARDSQNVLKAEAAKPDATDREVPVTTSPVGGPMGAGQPAAAGPAVVAVLEASDREALLDMSPGAVMFVAGPTMTNYSVSLRDLFAHLRIQLDGKFPKQPKPTPDWWSELRVMVDQLAPRPPVTSNEGGAE